MIFTPLGYVQISCKYKKFPAWELWGELGEQTCSLYAGGYRGTQYYPRFVAAGA